MDRINLRPVTGMNLSTGYGKLEVGLWRGLIDHGIEVRFDQDPRAEITIITARPEAAIGLDCKRLWLFTMSESTIVSDRWVNQINALYERVLVPSPDLVDIYINSGVKVPVSFVPLGVDLYPPKFIKREIESPTIFLTYSLGDMRKGAEIAMVAFSRLFKKDMTKQLWIKARDYKDTWLEGCEDPQFKLIAGETSESDWHNLLAQVHVFIMPTRGEGWNMPARETTLAGIPTLCTQWLGTWDIDQWGIPIPVKEFRQSHFDIEAANRVDALWAEPDRDRLTELLKDVHDHYPLYANKMLDNRHYLIKNFRWYDSVDYLLKLV